MVLFLLKYKETLEQINIDCVWVELNKIDNIANIEPLGKFL